MKQLLLSIWFAASSFAIANTPDVTLPDHATILPTSEGPKLIRQCSRPSPENVTDFWVPSVTDVMAAEKTLPEMLRASGHTIDLRNTNRQYLGILAGGKKLIYVNGFVANPQSPNDWKTRATVVCDGGDAFWGAEFDPVENTFTHFEFNGPSRRD